jgi:hypothetical protein
MWKAIAIGCAIALLLSASSAFAAETVAIETVLSNLTNPCGLVIRPGDSPERYEIFVADSGAQRVIRLWSNEPEKSVDVVTGFAPGTLGGRPLRVGPIALLFLDRNQLVVGSSGDEGHALVRLYELTDPAAELVADQAKQKVEFPAESGADHIYALTRTRANERVPDAIILTSFRKDRSGQLRKIPIRAGMLGEMQPFGAAKDSADANQPAAVGLAESTFLVAGQTGALDESRDSRLVFYNPIDGAESMDLPVELYDVVGLAYSPRSGNLYAADIAWMAPDQGGVYRIDDASEPGQRRCAAVKVADVARPSALAFGPDGALFVAAFGQPSDSGSNTGVLLKLTGEL